MKREMQHSIGRLMLGMAVAAGFAQLLVTEAAAQARCFEGRTRDGECVNATLAAAQRHQSIIASQPKISLTAPIYPPSEDAYYPHALDHHEARAIYGLPTRPSGFPLP
jgi:hypothetical protein